MITDKIKELQKLRAQTAELENSLQREQAKALALLPKEYGFATAEAFIDAVRAATGGRNVRNGKAPNTSSSKRRKRAVITPEIRSKVSELVKQGKTGSEIAKAVGISLPSVQNIKKAAGLVGNKGRRQKPAGKKS